MKMDKFFILLNVFSTLNKRNLFDEYFILLKFIYPLSVFFYDDNDDVDVVVDDDEQW